MQKDIKKFLMIAAGVIFLILGLIGLALPFLQGFFFLSIGVVLLSLASTRIQTWVEMQTRPYPKVHRFVARTQKWIIRIIGSID